MIRQEDVYKIGRMGKPHGVGGELSFAFDDDVFDRTDADYLVLNIDGILVPFFIEEYRFKSNETAIVKFLDVDTQEAARRLTGCEVCFPRHIAESDTDNTSWAEIIGYGAEEAQTGQRKGTIVHVDTSTQNTLFTIATDDGRNVLVPASDELITAIDKERHMVVMTFPDGIFTL